MRPNRTLKTAIALALAGVSSLSFAQQPANNAQLDVVIVTGTYIRGSAEDAALPVDVITADDLQKQGSPSTLEMLKSLSVSNGVLGDSNQFDARAQGSEGAGSVNLRGLGPQRTLVLLNGKRMVNNPFTGAVDTNLIPAAAIGRIEVLKDGAAATYGSDAIAGVVNFITKEKFRGVELSGDYKFIKGSDGGDYNAGVAFGWAGDNSELLLTAGYQHRSELLVNERDWAVKGYLENPQGGWSAAGNPASFIPVGATASTPTSTPANPLGVGTAFRDPACATLGGVPGLSGATPVCYWQYTRFDALTEKEERYQAFGAYDVDFGNSIKFHLEGLYAGTEIPIYRTSPSYAALQTPASPIPGFYFVPANNPGYLAFRTANPTSGLVTAPVTPGAPVGALVVAYRPFALGGNPLFDYGSSEGPRRYNAFRLSSGLRGEIGDNFGWDVNVTYMEQNAHREGRDTVVNRLQLALNGLGGPNCVTNTPGANGCFWLNPFSNAIPGGIANGVANPGYSPAVANNNLTLVDWMFPLVSTDQTQDILVFDAVVNGKTGFTLPGGDVAWAAGAQYRDTSFKTDYSDLNDFAVVPCPNSVGQANNIVGPAGCTAAQLAAPPGPLLFLGGAFDRNFSQDLYAVFGELSLPILENLQAQLAARYEDYGGLVGSTFDPKLSLRWQVFDALALRGSVGTTFRGPPLNQLDPGAVTTLQNIGGTFRAVRTSGNAGLAPESATTFNVGAIVKTGGFSGSLDYWSFKFDNPIVNEPVAGIANALFPVTTLAVTDPAHPCNAAAFAALRNRFTFNTSGCASANIVRLDINVINGSEIETSGLDFAGKYDFSVLGGQLTLGTDLTYVLKYDISAVTVEGIVVQPAFDAAGKLNYQTTAFPIPKLKGDVFLEFSSGMHNVRLQTNYAQGYTDQRTDIFTASAATNNIAILGGKEIANTWLHNVYYRAQFEGDLTLTIAIENVTDRDPPFARLDLSYDPFTASAFGRTGKIGLRKKF